MTNTVKLLDRVRKLTKTGSDYAIAKKLGVPHQLVSNWMKGVGTPDTANAIRIAELLEREPLQVIALIELDRRPKPKNRAIWERYAGRISAALAGLALIAPLDANSVPHSLQVTDVNRHFIHYAHIRR